MNPPIPTNRRPSVPGETLLHDFLKPLGISQLQFAKHIGFTPAKLNEIVKGKRAVTPETALLFANALSTSPSFWLNLQQQVDLYDAMHSDRAKTIRKVKPIVKDAAA
jgi:addiction module HigA family antidote